MKKEIKVFMPCSDCAGSGNALQKPCPSCKGEGKQELKNDHPEYAKYYRMTLKREIENSMNDIMAATKHYQNSLEDYDFYIRLLRKLDMQQESKTKGLAEKL